MKIGTVTIGNDYPGATWDFILVVVPGSIFSIFIAFVCNDFVVPYLSQLFIFNSILGFVVLLIISFVVGQLSYGISTIIFGKKGFWSRGMLLKKSIDVKTKSVFILYRQSLLRQILKDKQEYLEENNYEHLYYMAVQFIRLKSISHYNLYIGRYYVLSQTSMNLFTVISLINIILIVKIILLFSFIYFAALVISIVISLLFLSYSISEREYMVNNVLRAVYLLDNFPDITNNNIHSISD